MSDEEVFIGHKSRNDLFLFVGCFKFAVEGYREVALFFLILFNNLRILNILIVM